MHTLTVGAGFADDMTFLSSIPLAYHSNTSVFDEIIALRAQGALTYIDLIKYVNTPGANCWAFGSVEIAMNSISKSDATSTGFQLYGLDFTDTTGSNGNSLNSLWSLFNAVNTLPSPYSSVNSNTSNAPVTMSNVQPSVDNYVTLNDFLAQSWGENKDYTNLVSYAKIPVEVLLCTDYYLVNASNFAYASYMNNLWNFLTNTNTGVNSVTIGQTTINTNTPLVEPLAFKSALSYLETIGFAVEQVLNVDKTRTVSSFSNAVSAVVTLVAATPSLINDVDTIFTTWSSYSNPNNYLIALVKQFNDAITNCLNLGATGAPVNAVYPVANNVVVPAYLSTVTEPVAVFTSSNANRQNAWNQLSFAGTMLNLALSADLANLAFRMSLNGYYPLTTLKLEQASSFLLNEDGVVDIINFVQNTANMTMKSTASTLRLMESYDLYLFNKLMSVGTSGVVATYVDSGKTVSFDFATLLSYEDAVTTKFILGNGLPEPVYNNNEQLTESIRVYVESAIARAYHVTPSYVLIANVNNLDDYSTDGVIGNLTTSPNASSDIDNMLFTTPQGKVARAVQESGRVSSTDYQTIANIMSKIISYGMSFSDIKPEEGIPAVILDAIGGNFDVAVASYLVLGNMSPSERADRLNWLLNPTANSGVDATTLTDTVETGSSYNETVQYRNKPIIDGIVRVVNATRANFGLALVTSGSSSVNCIKSEWMLINYIFNSATRFNGSVPLFADSNTLRSIERAFFIELTGLSLNDVQDQIIIKKLMGVYNNLNNNVLNYVYAENTALGLWAKYVNLEYLCYTNNTHTVTNYTVDEILNVAQQMAIYDFSSGRSTGIVSVQLITAEELVSAGIINVAELPEYISYATPGSNDGSAGIVPSQQANLQLIVTVTKAMDIASNTQTYTHIIYSALGEVVDGVIASPEQQNSLFRAIVMDGTYAVTELAREALMRINDVSKLVNNVLGKFNADGTPSIAFNPYVENPYISA